MTNEAVQTLYEFYLTLYDLNFLSVLVRLFLAMLLGGILGYGREKKHLPAGFRTYMVVCLGSALAMMVGIYVTDLTGAADASRIGAQVVSGISFLGAGVIFKHGNAVRGLTTAAGLWATAGIGLAMGAGMYPVGVFGTLMIALLQILMHKFVMQADALASNHLHFTVQDSAQFHERLGDYLQERNVQIMDSRITYHDDGFVSYDITVRAPREMTISDLNQFLRSCGDVRGVSYTPIY